MTVSVCEQAKKKKTVGRMLVVVFLSSYDWAITLQSGYRTTDSIVDDILDMELELYKEYLGSRERK